MRDQNRAIGMVCRSDVSCSTDEAFPVIFETDLLGQDRDDDVSGEGDDDGVKGSFVLELILCPVPARLTEEVHAGRFISFVQGVVKLRCIHIDAGGWLMGDWKIDEPSGADEVAFEGSFTGVCLPPIHAGALAEFIRMMEQPVDVPLYFLDRAGQCDPGSHRGFNRLHVLQYAKGDDFEVRSFEVAEESPVRPDGIKVGVERTDFRDFVIHPWVIAVAYDPDCERAHQLCKRLSAGHVLTR